MPFVTANRYHYLPAGDDAISWGVYLTGCGSCAVGPGEAYPPPGHPSLYDFDWDHGRILPEFQFLLVGSGTGVFETASVGARRVAGGTLLTLLPDVWHRYRPDSRTGWTERWVSLNGELMHRLADAGTIGIDRAVSPVQDAEQLCLAFDRVIDDVARDPLRNPVIRSLQVLGLVGTLLEARTGAAGGPTAPRQGGVVADAFVSHLLDVIWSHSHRQLGVDEIVAGLGLSRRTVERRFRAAVGHGIGHEIVRCRLSRARRLLRETRLPIHIVSRLAGFGSEERMRVTFHRQQGCSPNTYRRRNLAG